MIAKVTTSMISKSNTYDFIEMTIGDIQGVKQGEQWDMRYQYMVFTRDYPETADSWWVQYSIRTGYTGNVAYENPELAAKLNRKMDALDKKGFGYFLHIPVGNKYYLFSNVYSTRDGYLYVGERRASNLREDIPQYLPTPTF